MILFAKRKEATDKRESSSDAIDLLKRDHRHVEALFAKFENAEGKEEKLATAQESCNELKVHTQIEEKLFYPAAREALEEDDLVDEATVEHGSIKQLIADIESTSAKDDLFDAKLKVLKEYVAHHVRE